MKFVVTRTSIFNKKVKPCEEAQPFEVTEYFDVRYFVDKEEWLKKFPKDDTKEVIRWGVTKSGNPYRVLPTSLDCIWTIEINSLVELMKFIEKYGHIVINPEMHLTYKESENIPEIEIYDNYRE